MTANNGANALAVLPKDQALAVRTPEETAMALERVVTMGDLRQLDPGERVAYYLDLCQSLGLNPRSRPFDWILFKEGRDGPERLALYPNASCTAQLRSIHRIMVMIVRREIVGELFMVEAKGRMPNGREDTATKYVPITYQDGNRYKGQQLANAFMKAETGAKRRVTLSLIGLSGPASIDDDEPAGRQVVVDGRGEIIEHPTDMDRALARDPAMAALVREPTYEDVDPSGSPLAGTTDQRPDTSEPEREPIERQSLRADAEKQMAAWHAAVKGTSYEDAEVRHAFIFEYTSTWPEQGRTDSLRTFLDRATNRQARDLIERVRTLAERERRELLEMVDEEESEGEPEQAAF